MRDELSPMVVKALEQMPAFPHSVQKILQMTRDMQCAAKDIVFVIENDPLMAVKVLRVVNSAHYGLPQKITSIGHAVVYLGLNTIKNVALSIAAIGVLPHFKVGNFESHGYLVHSLATAAFARHMAMRRAYADPMEVFIAGLLHDLGKVVLALHMPQALQVAMEYSQWHGVSLHEALRNMLGVDHAQISASLLERWQFAPEVVHTVRCQSGDPAPTTLAAACVFAANQASKLMQLGNSGNACVAPLPQEAQRLLGMDMPSLMAEMGDAKTLIAQVQIFVNLQ